MRIGWKRRKSPSFWRDENQRPLDSYASNSTPQPLPKPQRLGNYNYLCSGAGENRFYQLEIFWQVEDDAEDDGGYHVAHDSSPGLVGSGNHREVVLHGFGDRQVPLDGQDDRGDHGAHQRDRLKLVEEVDESDHLKKARQWNLRFSSMDLSVAQLRGNVHSSNLIAPGSKLGVIPRTIARMSTSPPSWTAIFIQLSI